MKKQPVFIVGVQRSGTTLLAAMLAAHSSMSCGPETHFFRRLAGTNADQLCNQDSWPETAVDFIGSIKHSGFSEHEAKFLLDKYQIEKEQVVKFLASKEPSIPNILASVTEQYMTRVGKSRWVEKTPDHIEYLQLIRTYYPDAPIIRIVRDPRDVALSLTKVPWGAKTILEGLLFWKRLDQASEQFFLTDKRCYTLRFEDLVSSPGETLQQLCQFIGEVYEEAMLDTSNTGQRINSRSVPWKNKVSQPLDSSRISVWRHELTKQENQLAEAILGDRLEFYGYPRVENFVRLGEIFPTSVVPIKYVNGLEAVAAAGVRFWKSCPDEKSTATIYVGDPGKNNWWGGKKAQKVIDTLAISGEVIKAALSNNQVYWIPDCDEKEWSGYFAFLLKKLLTSHRVLPES